MPDEKSPYPPGTPVRRRVDGRVVVVAADFGPQAAYRYLCEWAEGGEGRMSAYRPEELEPVAP